MTCQVKVLRLRLLEAPAEYTASAEAQRERSSKGEG